MSRAKPLPFRLVLVTDLSIAGGEAALLDRVEAAAEAGGERIAVQLREKDLSPDALFHLAERMKKRLDRHRTPLLINDRADIAAAVGARGVQLRVQSIPAEAARACLPAGAWVGRSTHSVDEVKRATKEGATFALFGPVFGTPSKSPHGPPQGMATLSVACAAAGEMPVFAIGGITPEEVARVRACGAFGVAAQRALVDTASAAAATRAFLDRLES